jgi:localization factor PodJL
LSPAWGSAQSPETPAATPEPPREPAAGGLFSRFTSSQLLKRATGGRAESFSPDVEDADGPADLPLEPGTDAPLNSALVGAPSSDTALMSGSRGRARIGVGATRGTELEPIRPRGVTAEPTSADEFLAAARRAAQAAAAEAVEAEREAQEARDMLGMGRIVGMLRTRRSAVLAGVVGIAVALAALQIVRNQMGAEEIEVAGLAPMAPASDDVIEAAPEPVASVEPESAPVQAEVARPPAPPPSAEPAAVPPVPAPQPPPAEPVAASQDPGPDAAPAPPSPEPPAVTASVEPGFDPMLAPLDPDIITPAPEAPAAAGARPAALQPPTALSPPEGLPAPVGPERLREAASAGNPVAAFEVAARYAEGRGVNEDLTAAVAWYRHAAESGLAPAQYRLGSIFEKGLGVPKDAVQAQDWYRRAADAGNVKAMHNLAVLYAEGAGGEPDLEGAAELFRQAAEHGVRDSQFNLAILHARGLGVPQDLIEAYKWFAVAASSGDAESLKRRDIIAAALSPDDLAKAQAAAAAFQPLPLIAEANDVMMPDGGWGEDTTSVQLDSEKDVVTLVQMLLAEQGYDPGPADGLLGEQTIQAIAKFQEQAGLPPTGQIDNGLVTALKEQST